MNTAIADKTLYLVAKKGTGKDSTKEIRLKIFEKTGLTASAYAKKHGFNQGQFYLFMKDYGKRTFEGVKRLQMQNQLLKDGIVLKPSKRVG